MNLQDKINRLKENCFDEQEYKRYKVTATLKNSVVINGHLYLDGILSYARLKRAIGDDIYNLPESPDPIEIALPLSQKDEVYLCSKARLYRQVVQPNRWRKRFDSTKAEKYMEPKKVDTARGIHKNYDMPISVTVTPKISWIVVGDKKEIGLLLKEITHIGKKGSQGYGIVKKWSVELTDEKGERHFPVEEIKEGDVAEFAAYKPPYWLPQNVKLCVIKDF